MLKHLPNVRGSRGRSFYGFAGQGGPLIFVSALLIRAYNSLLGETEPGSAEEQPGKG